LNPTNKRSHIHRMNKNRTSESDIDDKFKVIDIIKYHFGLHALEGETVAIPNGIANYRSPDLMVNTTLPTYLIELMGESHNLDEENPPRVKDIQKREDLARLGKNYKLIEIWKKHGVYEKEHVISTLWNGGLPVNEDVAQHYRNRKVSRYS